MSTIVNVSKEKTAISFHLDDKPNPVIIDFVNGTIISFTGRSVKHTPERLVNAGGEIFYRTLLGKLIDCITNHHELKKESCLSYMDLINPDTYYDDLPCEIPKGYINYLRENGLNLNHRTLKNFKDYQASMKLPEQYRAIFQRMTKALIQWNFDWLTIDKKILICKIARVTEKACNWEIKNDACDFLDYVFNHNELDWTSIVDTNRDFSYNERLLKSAKSKMISAGIAKTQEKFKYLEKLETKEFQIVVPTCIEQLQDEGKQQNNCVGYFYNQKIIDGTYAIYFIRRKTNPDKSFVTCRIDIERKETVEHRYFNNRDCNDSNEPECKFINLIDENL